MAARQVSRPGRGFTLIELMVTIAVCAALIALATEAMRTSRKVARVTGQARFIVQKLQTVRTQAVGQGAAQGYYFGPNGTGAAGPDANQAFVFYKQNPTATVVSYVSASDRKDLSHDNLPTVGNQSVVVVTGAGVVQPAPFQIGFNMNGQVTVTPAPGSFPYCITVSDLTEPGLFRYVIIFNDGTTKVQRDETWCP